MKLANVPTAAVEGDGDGEVGGGAHTAESTHF